MGNSDSRSMEDNESTVHTKGSHYTETTEDDFGREMMGRDRRSSSTRKEAPEPLSLAQQPQRRDDEPPTMKITDDQINVNLAMADLMAYLQVVANNSNHLPITRRDDPEIERTVTSLNSEEYARKSAAFVPADIRVIGGTFTRYGRVWDLPTSEVCACLFCWLV